ncbi:S9 family peptidase [Paenibacillus sp. NAIST15-1]|uniref:alpha/beta hydrolase family protein n=1 Tax=Paenibacillus sp. NAIST15-1 TaxID=1605994 RepID=UPI0009331E26|nr:alpha/beta hydrolase [Paenibacillus sp. NAIST15-1]
MTFEQGRSGIRPHLFVNQEMDVQLMRTWSTMSEGGAEIGELLNVVRNTSDGDIESYARALSEAAYRVQKQADKALAEGHRRSAHLAYLRACSYYRSAMGALSPLQADHRRYWEQSRDAFEHACELLEIVWKKHEVPYKQGVLPSYLLCAPSPANASQPTLIVATGGEGTAMETYLWIGAECIRRGYNVLLYEGPHNPGAKYAGGLGLLDPEECEHCMSLVIDQIINNPNVDSSRIAVIGFSFGGYVAIRSAAHDPRIRALIANSPVRSLYEVLRTAIPMEALQFSNEMITEIVSPAEKAILDVAMTAFGADSLLELMNTLQRYNVDGIEQNIHCPTLSLAGEEEGSDFLLQARAFHRNIPAANKELKIFTVEEGAAAHCQVNHLSLMRQYTFDFLDRVFQ